MSRGWKSEKCKAPRRRQTRRLLPPPRNTPDHPAADDIHHCEVCGLPHPNGPSRCQKALNVYAPPHFPTCLHCGGALKPDVVFFGDNVPRPKVEAAFSMLEEGDALLVVG